MTWPFKNLTNRKTSNKLFRHKTFNIAKSSGCDGY